MFKPAFAIVNSAAVVAVMAYLLTDFWNRPLF